MKNSLFQKPCTAKTIRRFLAVLLTVAMLCGLCACAKSQDTAAPGKMDITGLYEGTTTVMAAKNDTLGEVKPLEFRIVQNDNGTATLLRDGISVDGTYNPETGEFSLDYGFTWNLVFSREGDTIVAKGTMTSNETGEGYTQEITLELKRTGD